MHWSGEELPVTEPVMLTISYFYDRVQMDVDNIPKPISDALKWKQEISEKNSAFMR